MVIDFTGAVSATKYLSVYGDNADKVFILSPKPLTQKDLGSNLRSSVCRARQDDKNKWVPMM